MTSTMAASGLVWESVATGIWIGRRDGRFTGVIEARPSGDFSVSDCVDTVIVATLDEAKNAIS